MKKKVAKKKLKTNNKELLKKLDKSKRINIILVIILLCFIIFNVIHFMTTNHDAKEVKVVNKLLDNNYVFLGDSITAGYDLEEFFPDLPMVNSGVPGYRAKDIISRLDNMVYRYNPSKVFLLIGTNDISRGKDKEYIIGRISKIIDEIKENRKYTEIYVESIYPINSSKVKNRKNDFINELNIEIKDLCKEKEINYIDIHKLLIDENGELKEEYSDDGLHITYEGYEVITQELEKYLK